MKTKFPANLDKLSIKVEEKENSFIIEEALNKDMTRMIGNPLKRLQK